MRPFRDLLGVFLLCFVSCGGELCSPDQFGCLSRNIFTEYLCVNSLDQCPQRPLCSDSSAYVLCADDSCAATPQACLLRVWAEGFACANSRMCWDGSCMPSLADCPTIPACPNAFDQRCNDLSCSQNCSGQPSMQTVLGNGAPEYELIFNQNEPGYLNFNLSGCFMGDIRCPDGSCESSVEKCMTGPSNDGAGGLANWGGCPSGTVRCWGDRFGLCNTSLSDCVPPPALQQVLPFVGAIGPTSVNFTLLSLTNTSQQFGWVYVPPFMASNSTYLNFILQPQPIPGYWLYPFDTIFHPDIGSNFTGLPELTSVKQGSSWRTSTMYPPLDSPMQSIFTPVIELYSPQLYEAFFNATENEQEGAILLLQQAWNINVTMYASPPFLSSCGVPICLAQIGIQSMYAENAPVWICIDSQPKELQPGLWSGLVPTVYLSVDSYYAFIALYTAADCTFGRTESVGGGFFAAGMIFAVVAGIILLANREKVVGAFVKSTG